MNYESPFFKNSVALLGSMALGFFAFITIVQPFQDTATHARQEQTTRQITALKKIRPPVSVPIPTIDAQSYMVRLAGEREPLLSRRAFKRMPPASLTKLMTATLAQEELNPADMVTFSEKSKEVESIQSSAGVGESFLRDHALKFAVIASANDAAQALAEAVEKKYHINKSGTTHTTFVDLMNKKATELGMPNSHFQNTVGLDNPDHFMSAADIARLLEYMLQRHRGIFEISRTLETTVYSVDRKGHIIMNTDDLLKEFPAILGSKTGFTDAAQGTLALLYPVKPNHTALIILMGSRDRFGDGRKFIRWLEDSFQ